MHTVQRDKEIHLTQKDIKMATENVKNAVLSNWDKLSLKDGFIYVLGM